MLFVTTIFVFWATVSDAHTAAWSKGMYCLNGTTPGTDNPNNDVPVRPLYQLSKTDWWFQHDRGCDQFPPATEDYLELPAGGQATLELAHNRAQTTLSFDGASAGDWPDGRSHPEDWNGSAYPPENCIQDDGAMHTSNESTAAGTALAISYVSNLEDVTIENLVVFSILANTPWKRIANYDVPLGMPACPEQGCICAWLWVPKGCGIPNMYMAGYKCKVSGATSSTPISTHARPPIYCIDNPSLCVKGAKQMIAYNQLDGNNVQVPPGASPGYSMVNGFSAGAQNDIFDQGAMALQSTLNMTLSLNSTQSALSPPSSTSSEVPAVREQVVRRRI